MTDYRFYFLDPKGHIERGMDMVFPCDQDAVEHARVIGSEHGIEIWEGKRLVKEVLP